MMISKRVFLLIVLLWSVSFLGCDQINGIKDALLGTSETTQPSKAKPDLSSPQASNAPMSANMLARVGDWSITVEEFNQKIATIEDSLPPDAAEKLDAKKIILEGLVRQQLLVIDAEQSGLAQDPEIVEAVDEFRRSLIVESSAQKLLENIDVTDEEVSAFYEERQDELFEPIQWTLREIVVDSQLEANELLIDVLKGQDFAETARLNSVADSKEKGGNIGTLYLDELPFPQMANALISLEAGDISSVFKGPEGFYIVKVEQKTGGQKVPFEEIKDKIKEHLLVLKQQDAILVHVNKLQENIKIETNEALLE